MKRELLFFTMLCCMAFSANACGTNDASSHSGKTEIATGDDENAFDTVASDSGLFDLSKGENGQPTVITLSSGYSMPVLGLGTYSLHGDECINAILKENISVFDFELTPEEMTRIDALDRNEKHDWY